MTSPSPSATDDVLEELCSFATELSYDDLPAETIETAKLRIFDSVAVALMALREEPVQELVAYASTKRGEVPVSILGTDRTASLEYATFATAGAIRYLDWNDTYLTAEAAHPSGNVGAILAAADANGNSGNEILLATVLAYEAQCRLCDMASFTGNGFDHVNYGLVSVPLAVGKLMGLSEEELREAVSIALGGHLSLLQARQVPLSEWKSFAFGNVARNGVVATELAQRGIQGPPQIFTGRYGVDSVVDSGLEPDDLTLGDGFLIDETHLKRYPICYHILSAVDCVEEIVNETALSLREVRSIDVDTYEIAIDATARSGKWRPTTRGTADHSLPYCVARTLLDGTICPDDLNEDRLAEDDVIELMNAVDVHHEESYTDRYGDSFSHKMSITTDDGEYERKIDYPQGHFKNPLSEDHIAGKILDHSTCPPDAVDQLREAVDALEGVRDTDILLESAAIVREHL